MDLNVIINHVNTVIKEMQFCHSAHLMKPNRPTLEALWTELQLSGYVGQIKNSQANCTSISGVE